MPNCCTMHIAPDILHAKTHHHVHSKVINQGQHSSTGSSDYYKMLHAAVIHCNIVYMWNTFLHMEYHNICKLITCKRVRDSKVQMKIKIKGGALLKSFGDEGTFREAQSSQVHQSNFDRTLYQLCAHCVPMQVKSHCFSDFWNNKDHHIFAEPGHEM